MFYIAKRWHKESRDIPASWSWLILSEQWLQEIGLDKRLWFEVSPPECLEWVTAEEATAMFREDPSGVLVIGNLTAEMEWFVSIVKSLGYNVHL